MRLERTIRQAAGPNRSLPLGLESGAGLTAWHEPLAKEHEGEQTRSQEQQGAWLGGGYGGQRYVAEIGLWTGVAEEHFQVAGSDGRASRECECFQAEGPCRDAVRPGGPVGKPAGRAQEIGARARTLVESEVIAGDQVIVAVPDVHGKRIRRIGSQGADVLRKRPAVDVGDSVFAGWKRVVIIAGRRELARIIHGGAVGVPVENRGDVISATGSHAGEIEGLAGVERLEIAVCDEVDAVGFRRASAEETKNCDNTHQEPSF